MGAVGEDRRWDIMLDLAAYFEKTFPRIHKSLRLDKINTHGLLYTWQGLDESLDVVPVANATRGEWEHPPFSGEYDGKYIWSRGAMDCKNTRVGIMEAVEKLLEADFEPKRTVVLSFGFDEELSGKRGADHLAATLLERYGKKGIASIVDEGAGIMNKDRLAREAAKDSPEVKYMFTTSQAVDVVGGGVKANALPERTAALVNHCINVGERPADVQMKLTKITESIAKKYNLTLNAFNGKAEIPFSISLFTDDNVLSPAPITPTSISSITPYSIFSDTARALYGKEIIVTPAIMSGNTDTRFYWDLTEHIFRYSPGWTPGGEFLGGHAVNEKISVVNHVRTV
ncbi:hypothetical protein QQS21_007798 [Conoideocrella luteorostrata]|uniref:Peptidase M20 dimerisation domain-containing protein n=1 Tax=Conoideocrella luteorostrata TaxID=1105319 RepID=A0AAJ0CMX2_9HYPO|nr:hypothetical protein QQS21_007798 [Conoideocrella luteorostrata]